MPLYEYVCPSCSYVFEELKSLKEDSTKSPCKKCGQSADKKMSRAAAVVVGGSAVESIDMTVGREASKRWQSYTDKQSARRKKGTELSSVSVPKAGDGKFMPVMALGGKVEKEKRQEFSSALQEHRDDRKKKNKPQFSEAGAF